MNISYMAFMNNIKDFLQSLTVIDVIFFFSVILLMILVVTLIYFIKLNEDVKEHTEEYVEEINRDSNVENKEELKYLPEEEGELLDLESITKALESKEAPNIDLTAFEEEQEKEAIISYDELISKAKTGTINYKSENMLDDLSVKEVDLEHLINETGKPEIEVTKSQVISYAQEEAFLEALKKLQKQIN